METKPNLGRSDSLSARQTAFGRLFITMCIGFQDPYIALGIASLATLMLSSLETYNWDLMSID